MQKYSTSTWLLFLIPSLLGILLFLVPVPTEDGWLVTIAVLANIMAGAIESIVPWIMMGILIVAALGSLLFVTKKVNETEYVSFFDKLFNVNLFWTFASAPSFFRFILASAQFKLPVVRYVIRGRVMNG